MCREIEGACKGRGRECVFREREGGVYRERERKSERWKVCLERGKECVLKYSNV